MRIKFVGHIVATLIFMLHVISCAQTKVMEDEAQLLSPSIYYKPTVHFDSNKCTQDQMKEMLTPEGKVLTTICLVDFNRCLIEGSCFVDKAGSVRSFNYHSRIKDIPRFVEVDLRKCPFGYGVSSTCLDPYYTVAADLSLYKVGDVIYVPRLVGAPMPDGSTHDGFLVIRDRGARILGEGRFDFFTGFYNHAARDNIIARLGFGDPYARFDFRLATEEEAKITRERRGYPGLKNVVVVRALDRISRLSRTSPEAAEVIEKYEE
ncbi:3D domain-containing protein [Bdellovibrio sp. HCB209]|uniref:3D domain-containing protein n=1 Tax=Bdellovibrio sp. HCB209 TaxID=3394354 RepID=UPI0039B4B747